jgi:hypothetical protein
MSEENKLHNGQLLYIKTRFLPVVQVNFSPSYSGYPIFHYYKVTDAKIAKIENPTGGGFTRMDNKEYWRPFPSITETYEYTPGDELVQQIYQGRNTAVTEKDPANTASRLNNPTSVANTKYAGASTNEMKIWGGDTYKATTQTIKWESISKYDTIPVPALRMAKTNPYISENIRVWAKVGGSNLTQDTGFVYWWNPVDKVFHIVNPSIVFATNINTERVTGESQSQYSLRDSLNEGKILALILQGKTREQAIEQISNASAGGGAGGGAGGNGGAGSGSKGTATLAAGGGSTSSTTGTAPNSTIRATVRVRGNFGYIEPGEIEGGGAQMVQYYKSSSGQAPLTARHIFSPKPNQINYQNIGSEWTEIERAGRIPLVDWKNYKLMRVSFQFLVIPDETYRLGAFGETANDGITLSIDSKLEVLRNIAARPYPVILYGFDDLLANANPFSMSTGAGVQFAITDFSITSMMRTPTGSINRAQCDITLQEVPIEYINIISLPKLIPGQTIRPTNPGDEPEYGERLLITDQANQIVEVKGYESK